MTLNGDRFMNRILFISDIDFWNKGSGHRARLYSLISYLGRVFEISIIHIGRVAKEDIPWVAERFPFRFFFLNRDDSLTPKQYGKIAAKIAQTDEYKACVIEYIHNAYFLAFLPETLPTFLDIHDLLYEKIASFIEFGYTAGGFNCSKGDEFKIYSLCNYVLPICTRDSLSLSRELDEKRIITVSHAPAVSTKLSIRSGNTLGYYASEYQPNVDALEYFLNDIWPAVKEKTGYCLMIFGKVEAYFCRSNFLNDSRIFFMGFVENENEVFNAIDIVVNPIRFGAGIKIKNLEALAMGTPLITSRHGSRGLEGGANSCFLVADSVDEYLGWLILLEKNFDFRNRLSQKAIEFIRTFFCEDVCYGQLASL